MRLLLYITLTALVHIAAAGEWALASRAATDVVIARAGGLVADGVVTDSGGASVRLVRQSVQIQLVLKGQLQPATSLTVIHEGHDTPGPTSAILLPEGTLFLLALAVGNGSGQVNRNLIKDHTFAIPSSERLIRLETSLAERTYTLEGADEIQKAASIFAQSFESDGKGILGVELAAPAFTTASGVYEQFDGDGDQSSPGFLAFYNATIEPRLLQAAGSDLRKRANVFATSVAVGVLTRQTDFRATILELEATWPDPNEDIGVALSDSDIGWLTERLSSRLKCFRRNAIERFPHILAHRNTIILLVNDPQEDVRVEALRWLQRLRLPASPQIEWNLEATGPKILNEAQLKAYWNAMIPPP